MLSISLFLSPRQAASANAAAASPDDGFIPGANGTAGALAVQPDGKILPGGYFNMLDGRADAHIGRLSADMPALQTLTTDPGGSTITWSRSGNGPELDGPQSGPVYIVNTTADPGDGVCNDIQQGDCTLREAIAAAEAHPNGASPDAIYFNILSGCDATTGVCTIAPTTALPIIHEAVVIDGYTQPGASPNTLAAGNNARLLIELNGSNAPSSTYGLYFWTGSSSVRGLVINRFGQYGIFITGNSNENTIAGNFIGTDPTGKAKLGNTRGGVYVSNANNIIGGTNPAARNLISGNGGDGLTVIGTSNQVLGNYVGTDASGTISLGNTVDGIRVSSNGGNNIIGGLTPEARNLLSGNGASGLNLYGGLSMGNIVQGNFIGTDVTGMISLGNRSCGVWIDGGINNTIGGSILEARNLISGNGYCGMVINNDGTGNIVQGNFIGVNVTGTVTLGNADDGISLVNAPYNTIGGTAALAGNLISGNGGDGLSIINASAGNIVQGNAIGTDVTGTFSLGNNKHGIVIMNGVPIPSTGSVLIGGTNLGARNIISGNRLDGIHIQSFDGAIIGNSVFGNAIFDNGGLGIGINEDGVTHNDTGDGDTGANHLQNFPLLTSLNNGVLGGTLNSTASSNFRLEFFASGACDPSGYGEGELLLGTQEVITDSSGNATFSFAYTSISGKPYLTANATNTDTGDTSEFSPCLPYATTTTTHSVSPSASSIYGESVTLSATVTTGIIENPIPTGQVQFKDGAVNLGAPVALDAQGSASFTTSALASGTHTLTAQFLPNEAYPGSSSSLTFTVNPKKILMVTGISARDKVYDGTTSAGLDTSGAALVGVDDGDDVLLITTGAQAAFADKDAGDHKTVSISGLALTGTKAGYYTLTPPALTASITPRLLTLTAEDKRKVYGEAVPALTVAYSGFAPGETPAVLTRNPELSTTATRTSPAGVYPVILTPGSPAALNYTFALREGVLTVENASTRLLLSAVPNPGPYRRTVTFTAAVEAVAPGAGLPGGTVTFLDGDNVLAIAGLNSDGNGGAAATFTTATLSLGSHTITASYSGDSNFIRSSGSIPYTVTPAGNLTITLHVSENPAAAGSLLTLTFTAANQGSGTAENSVMDIDLPEGLTFQSAASSAGIPCAFDRGVLTCELGDLAASASQTVTVRMVIPRDASGMYTIVGSVNSPSIILPDGGYPATALILTVQPRSFFFVPLLFR